MTAVLTQARLKELLHYDPETGVFTRLVQRGPARVGDVAGSFDKDGYIVIRLGRLYRAHRLAWLYVHGEMPEQDIDHKDTVRSHNWIDNLRPATMSQNIANSRVSINNKLGVKGVYKRHDRYAAKIGNRHIGYFDTPELASAAYGEAAAARFGEFARVA